MRSGIDNNILVWAIRKDLPPVDEAGRDVAELQRRARILIADLENKDVKVVIPAVVVAEFLCGVEKRNHQGVIATLVERFYCPPFDIHAAAVSAGLFVEGRSPRPEDDRPKRIFKVDTMVVASARVAGCSTFYSNDERCRRLAELAGMRARDLPTHSEDMFVNLEAKDSEVAEGSPPPASDDDLPPFSLE